MVYVTDVDFHRIAIFTTSGEFVTTSFGEKILQRPESITIDNDGFIYVTDRSRINSKLKAGLINGPATLCGADGVSS